MKKIFIFIFISIFSSTISANELNLRNASHISEKKSAFQKSVQFLKRNKKALILGLGIGVTLTFAGGAFFFYRTSLSQGNRGSNLAGTGEEGSLEHNWEKIRQRLATIAVRSPGEVFENRIDKENYVKVSANQNGTFNYHVQFRSTNGDLTTLGSNGITLNLQNPQTDRL